MPTLSANTLKRTEYDFAGQTGIYHGKVRDIYTIRDKYVVMIATDRISAFDTILPRPIPYKGQVLNQLAAYFLEKTEDIVPNWLMSAPDPNVSIGLKAEPVKIELVIRSCLVGHAWREYKSGKRTLSGVTLPDGMREYDSFPKPVITPTTKAESGHDEDITATDIVAQGLATKEEWEQLTVYMRELFDRGRQMAADRGLVLADTKYEFGRLDGKLILIDEVHTPDSSRYFHADSYRAFVEDKNDQAPEHLSKEFVRSWLMREGFSGKKGQEVPVLSDEFINEISERYIQLYEKMTGKDFVKQAQTDIVKRINDNVNKAIEELN
ncbi:MAG TPA: phosphoribosylaminoimidazolesuccinocarboxamide synthase [Candidatus Saccharimonadales bacterium]|nr:phosphoribosylaminoimidazolesuccinocarboxamide synthase [Candidatus Saccharimonadales bacterium]